MVVNDVAGGPLVFARKRVVLERAVVSSAVVDHLGLDERGGASHIGMREGDNCELPGYKRKGNYIPFQRGWTHHPALPCPLRPTHVVARVG
jgi:hypothetical protein